MTKTRFRRARYCALVALLLSAFGPAQDEAAALRPAQQSLPSAELPVTKVVLFTGGIGYFEHAGTVDGNVELELPVPAEAMDDLLQSLVLQDFGGGTIEPVRYPARDPLARVLGSYSLDLSGDPTLAAILSQARGEDVLVTTSEPIRGTVVNVEVVQVPDEEPRTYLTVLTTAGLKRVSLAEVREIQFDRRELQAELGAALAALARYRGDEEKGVRLRFSGEGTRRVSVGYIREMPVWKTSYRLIIGPGDEATLQGWAIFDNPTSMDLEEIDVSFIAGQPLSFITGLYEPVYVERLRVAPDVGAAIAPPAYAGELAPAQAAMDDRAGEFRSVAAPQALLAPAPDAGAGVAAMAAGVGAGAGFEYRVSLPVTIPRYESAMIPIVQRQVPAQQVAVFDPSVLADHPLHGVRLENDTGLHLPSGPVSVFYGTGSDFREDRPTETDGAIFAGNARMEDILPGDSRLLTFAVDLDVSIEVTGNSEPERVVWARLVNGLLETRSSQRITTEYRASTVGDVERTLIIEHPKRSGFELTAPAEPMETIRSYRFVMELGDDGDSDRAGVSTHASCETGAACVLTVVVERELHQSRSLSNISSDQIAFYLENVELSPVDEGALREILALMRQIADLGGRASALESQVDAIHRDQDRIRQNMQALDRNSSLYRRYVGDLEEQETLLDTLEHESAQTRQKRLDAQEELDRIIADME